jgi:SAM-dependent methyltransferase
MAGYQRFAPFYDEVMDDPSPRASRVIDAIDRYRTGAASLLELGCGTGSLLARLTDVPTLVGLDRSPEMLAVAGGKVPRAELVQGDLSSFSLGRRFDVVICVFDTLNHLLTFGAWRSAFDAAREHLAEDGLFIFDVNTVGELRRLGEDPPAVYDFARGVAIIDVAVAQDGEDSLMSQWDIRIFEDLGDCRYRLHHEQIGELGVRIARLRSAIETRFDLLELSDERGGPAGDESIKAHFVLRPTAGPQP